MLALHNIARRWLASLFALWLLAAPAATGALAQEVGPADARATLAQPLDVPEDWVTVRGRWVDLHGTVADERLLLKLAEHADRRIQELGNELRLPTGGTIHIYVAPSSAAFHQLQGGGVPEYADGTAWPLQGRIFLHRPTDRGANARPLEQVLDHELVHVLLGRAFAPSTPPRWLQEGVAQVVAGESDPEATRQLLSRRWLREPYRLDALRRGFPQDAGGARLAYAQSADLIRFLQVRHGEGVLPRLIRELAVDPRMELALPRATGESLVELETAWRKSLDTGLPSWLLALGDQDLWWSSIGLIGALGLIAARRRARERLREYAEEEAAREALLASLMGRPLRSE